MSKATITDRLGGTLPAGDYHRLLFESNPNPMWFHDLETLRFLDVNEAALRSYGYTREEFLELTTADICLPEDVPAMLAAIGGATEGLKTCERLWRHRRRDGTIIHVQITSHALRYDNHPAELVLAQDVTEQQAMQERLRESEARYRTLLESRFEGVIVHDSGVILDANLGAAMMFGIDLDQMIGTRITDYAAPESRDVVMHNVLTNLEEPYEARGLRADGTIFDAELLGRAHTYFGKHVRVTALRDITERKLAAARLRESQELFESYMNNLPAVAFLKDEEGRYLYANDAAKALYKSVDGDWRGRTDLDMFSEEVATVLRRNDDLVRAAERTLEFTEVVPRDGEMRHWTVLKFPFRNRSGRMLLAGVCFDITERQRAERRLRLSEQRFRALTENALDVITILDRAGRVLYESPAVERVTGYTAEERQGTSGFSGIHPEDLPGIEREFHYKLEHPGEVVGFEARLRRRDGAWIQIEGTGVNLLHDRAVRGVVVNWRDVTERKRIEAERDIERRVLDELVEQLPVGVAFRNREGRYVRANARGAAIFGMNRETIIGMTADELVSAAQFRHPDGKSLRGGDELTSSIATREGRAVGPLEHLITTPEGSVRHLVTNAVPIKIDGELLGTLVVSDDITERRQLEEQFLQAQKMEAVGRLAGGIAHDFNNLLTAITGYSDLLLRREDTNHATRNHVEQIRRAAERAARLTQQLLAFSRKQMLRTRVLNVNTVVSDLEGILRRLTGADVRMKMNLAPDLGTVEADPNQVEQVIVNLVVNARDAMPGGGEIVIETRNADLGEGCAEHSRHGLAPTCYCVLVVRDTGTGMDEETKRRMFEPFFTTKEVGKGTGLGLSTVHGIVKQSGGEIVVESALGAGTTFEIYLPRVGAPAATEESHTAPSLENHRAANRAAHAQTVLVVEDEEVVRQMASEVLRMSGYTVLEAEDGRRALEICREYGQRIDLMLSDVTMPEMSGAEIAREIKDVRPETRVLFTSGYADEAVFRRGVLDPGVAFIHKPWTPDALVAKVREVLEARKPLEAKSDAG